MNEVIGTRWERAGERLATEILRESEEFLRSQWQATIAGDQRAMQLVSAATTLAAGVVAAAGALIAVDRFTFALLVGTAVWMTLLVIAIASAIYAARPIDFHHPGNRPSHWEESDFANSFPQALGEQAEAYDRCIEKNAVKLVANGRAIIRAMWFFGCSPVAASVTALLAAWAVGAGVVSETWYQDFFGWAAGPSA